ncbi:acetyl-CoA carboxylase biotin carboxyl carrier protein [Nocardia niigatensis]|uniref:acetyl-CoA carboxylase biotin carboxyl carrier protein n=1 Tax=Nocardia niigatensis TaxID=209249 RepID=UPI0002F80C6C|nr:acetyl-CoA carboxylase biotin carboxyl carrier protein subunit [Nocardia niigatensis]
MTDNGSTLVRPDSTSSASGAAVVSAAEADHSLAVLARHTLAVRAGIVPAPTTVIVANGPVVLHVSWDGGRTDGAAVAQPAGTVQPAVAVAAAPEAGATAARPENGSQTAIFTLNAETVGVFYRSPEPGAAPFVAEGDPVRAGQQVAIIEAMKLMIPVTADREGVVAEFRVEDGESVEHGQPLIVFEVLR